MSNPFKQIGEYILGAFVIAMFIIIGVAIIEGVAKNASDAKTAEQIRNTEKPLLIFLDFPDIEPYLIIFGIIVAAVGSYAGYKHFFPSFKQ